MFDNIKFKDNELDYINENIFDSTQNIYVYAKYPNMPKCLPNTYNIACKNLPIGEYSLKGKHIDLHFNTKWKLAYIDRNFMDIRYTNESDVFNFIMRESLDRIMFQVKSKYKDIESIVKELRRQAIFNQRKLEQNNQALIQMDIKNHTDLGEQYNRESFYATINECIQDDTTLEIDSNNTLIDADTISLHSAKLIQDQIIITREKRKLFNLEKQYKKNSAKLNDTVQAFNNNQL